MQNTGKNKMPNQEHASPVSYYHQLLNRAGCKKDKNNPAKSDELAWFNIKHYQYIRHLSIRHLMTEIVIRGHLCTAPDFVAWDGSVLGPRDIFNTCNQKIIAGEPKLHPLFISHEKIPELNYLISPEDSTPILTLPVRELSIGDIDACYHALSAAETGEKFFSLEESRHPCYLGHTRKSELNPDTPLTILQTKGFRSHVEQIYLAVDPSFSKSQLIDAFRELLTDLDNQYGFFTPPAGHSTEIHQKLLSNIVNDNLIPLIDLLLWQITNRKTLPLRNIFNLLKGYPFDASSVKTGYSQTNFQSRYLRTFDRVMDQGNAGDILSQLLGKIDNYDVPFCDVTHKKTS